MYKKEYQAAIYTRLSSNEDKKNSIQMQIEIAKEYIKKNIESLEVFGIYTDLGKTGTNFKRSAFLTMMQDILAKKINCVIVKDFSRFGRNYLETENYLENIFPLLGVRFISVLDEYDTNLKIENGLRMTSHIKNLINEMYAKDFSRKAKIQIEQRKEKKEYIGTIPPYGYLLKQKTLIAEEAIVPIIKNIFFTYKKTKHISCVCKMLTLNLINPPFVYYKTKQIYQEKGKKYKAWNNTTIKRILENPIYKKIAGEDLFIEVQKLRSKTTQSFIKEKSSKREELDKIFMEIEKKGLYFYIKILSEDKKQKEKRRLEKQKSSFYIKYITKEISEKSFLDKIENCNIQIEKLKEREIQSFKRIIKEIKIYSKKRIKLILSSETFFAVL